MNNNIENFFCSLQNKKIAVIGMGVSHYDLIKLLRKKGLSVFVYDKRKKEQLENYDELKNAGVEFLLGENYLDSICNCDIIFRTPGMNFYNDALVKARQQGKVVTSEMEVFCEFCPCKLYAVTGSDGKTTTTTLISKMLEASGKTVHLGGNIGRALLPIIETISNADVAVVELSSFQLISMRQAPDTAVITNIAPNHLDVHKNMQEYIGAKSNIIAHQNAFSKAVLNFDNTQTRELSSMVRGKLCYFSLKEEPYNGTFLDKDGYINRVKNGQKVRIIHKDKIKLPGMHNVENFLAAIAALGEEVSDETICTVATSFSGVEHRIEFVRELDGVKYYNDSIATSPTRTIAGLDSFNKKIIIIAGGYDKKIPYEPLAPKIIEKVKLLILLGDTAPKIEKAVKECEGYTQETPKIINVSTLEEAVEVAKKYAQDGDIVSLSPASASFDSYKNFEQRGNHFKTVVKAL
ncbi:MAG: UDP-N-acetylmuramoyl-L-alanine--D-glutamate ligase [Oscillospiraceae bacterium]